MHKDDKNVDIGSHLYWRNVMQPLGTSISFIIQDKIPVLWGLRNIN